jgi:hypothetical protein
MGGRSIIERCGLKLKSIYRHSEMENGNKPSIIRVMMNTFVFCRFLAMNESWACNFLLVTLVFLLAVINDAANIREKVTETQSRQKRNPRSVSSITCYDLGTDPPPPLLNRLVPRPIEILGRAHLAGVRECDWSAGKPDWDEFRIHPRHLFRIYIYWEFLRIRHTNDLLNERYFAYNQDTTESTAEQSLTDVVKS